MRSRAHFITVVQKPDGALRVRPPRNGRSWRESTTEPGKKKWDGQHKVHYAAAASCGIDRYLLGLWCIFDSEWDWLSSVEDRKSLFRINVIIEQ